MGDDLGTARTAVRRSIAALGLLGVLGATACGEQSRSDEEQPPRARVVNTTVTLTAPEGHRVARCWFPDPGSRRGRLVGVVVPDTLRPERDSARECVLTDPDAPWSHGLVITVGETGSIGSFRERYVDPYEAEGGDDAVGGITEDGAATVFEGRTGHTLGFDSYNDGEQRHTEMAQVEDLRLTWSVPSEGFPDATYDDTEQADGIAGVQVVEDAPRPRR